MSNPTPEQDTPLELERRDDPDNPLYEQVVSHIPGHEGYIVVPKRLNARMFQEWWSRSGGRAKKAKQELHPYLASYGNLAPLVSEWHIDNLTEEETEGDGLDLPTPLLGLLVTMAVAPAISAASDPKLLLGTSTQP